MTVHIRGRAPTCPQLFSATGSGRRCHPPLSQAGDHPANNLPPVNGGSLEREVRRVRALAARRRRLGDVGMTTAEYAVGTVAACGFGGILYKLLTSDTVVKMLRDIIERALTVAF